MKNIVRFRQTTYLHTKNSKKEQKEVLPKLVSFRNLIPEIANSRYLTHSTHYYPAKFIPHVVRYCIEKFTKEKQNIIDPYAGSGTVGLEAYLCKRNSHLLDLNPILNHIIPIKIYTGHRILNKNTLLKKLKRLENRSKVFRPHWSRLEYWYDDRILSKLLKYWGYQKNLRQDIYSLIIEASLLKASKHFSYAEHRIPKLFRSKRKRQYINTLIKTNWQEQLRSMIFSNSLDILERINEFVYVTKNVSATVTFDGGVDSATHNFEPRKRFHCLITSPPYLQAQEYIRTSKMDLYWLGYSEDQIRSLTRLEIPYRQESRIINTKTLEALRSKIERQDLLRVLNSYFSLTIDGLEHSIEKMTKNSTICIFIGNPTISGHEVEIWRILLEYFVAKGLRFYEVFEDKIKSRQLFGSRNNKNPEGMKSEYLLVLRKNF
jgi:hypothetical protein